MRPEIQALSDADAVKILRIVSRRWVENAGLEAFIIYQRFGRVLDAEGFRVPDWIEESADHPSLKLVAASKTALSTIFDNQQHQASKWVADELCRLDQINAHALDPISLSIIGASLIGCLLAARVKKAGRGTIEFYEGISPELAKVFKASAEVVEKALGS